MSDTPNVSDISDSPAALLRKARRIVVKLGTNVLCRADGGVALGRVYSLIEEVADAHRAGREVILVSSGAISLGVQHLRMPQRPATLAEKQACAAVGQIRLMAFYQQAFESFGLTASQVLLTEEDFSDRSRYLNLRTTLQKLLEMKTVPIVNENDTVSTSEIETRIRGGERETLVFGDNDVLSALVASKLRADLLIVLSDVDGVYDRDPARDPGAQLLRTIRAVTPQIEAGASGGSSRGRGGMRTKLKAARIASASGATTVIAPGAQPGVIGAILAGGEAGTVILPRKPLSSRKRWLAFAAAVSGHVRVNRGAREALTGRRASLLFAGVTALEGAFAAGDVVGILDEEGYEFARGVANYGSQEARTLLGRHSSEIAALRAARGSDGGPPNPAEFIHRDNIANL